MTDTGVFFSYQDFKSLPPGYVQLFELGETVSFDLSLRWFELLAASGLPVGESTYLCGVEGSDAGRQPRVLLPLKQTGAQSLASLATYYSSYFVPLLASQNDTQSLVTLFSGLRHGPKRWAKIQLFPLPAEGDTLANTAQAMRQAGWFVKEYFCFGNWYLPVEDRSFEEYWRERPSQLRNTIERKQRRFLKAGGRLQLVAGGEALEQAVSAYEKIYAASWKKPEPFPDFLPGLTRQLAASGSLRLGLAFLGEQPVAAQLWIVSHGKAAIYKLAYDDSAKKLSPGSVLSRFMFEGVMSEAGLREIDYLIGDEPYKQQWMSCRRERHGLIAYNPATLGGALGAAKERLKRPVKRLLGRYA